jgi:ribosome-binding factor A
MDERRILKINHLIKQEVGKIILNELELPSSTLVTVTRVKSSNNLSSAKIYISVIPEEKYQDAIKEIDKKIFYVQKKLNKKLELRVVPRIIFEKEEQTIKADEVEKILEEIDKN